MFLIVDIVEQEIETANGLNVYVTIIRQCMIQKKIQWSINKIGCMRIMSLVKSKPKKGSQSENIYESKCMKIA